MSSETSSSVPSTHLKLKAASKTACRKKTGKCSFQRSEDKSREYQNSSELIQALETTVSISNNNSSSTLGQTGSTEQKATQAGMSHTQMQEINETKMSDKRSNQQNNQQRQSVNCSSCGKSISKSNLRRHEKTHTHTRNVHPSTKRFICKNSRNRFMASDNSKKHEKRHEMKAKQYDVSTNVVGDCTVKELVQQNCASTSSGLVRALHMCSSEQCTDMQVDENKLQSPAAEAEELVSKSPVSTETSSGVPSTHLRLKTASKTARRKKTDILRKSGDKSREYENSSEPIQVLETTVSISDSNASCTVGQTGSTDQEMAQISDKPNKNNHKGQSIECSFYGKSVQKNDLRSHENTHTRAKSYACQFCEKTFTTSSNQKRHEKLHKKNAEHETTLSDIVLVDEERDTLNVSNSHIMQDGRTCSYCSKTFPDKSKLKRHINTHTKETMYPCSICNKEFVDDSSRKRHEKIHSPTGTKIYICRYCDRQFTDSASCKSHETRHHISL